MTPPKLQPQGTRPNSAVASSSLKKHKDNLDSKTRQIPNQNEQMNPIMFNVKITGANTKTNLKGFIFEGQRKAWSMYNEA